MNLTVDNAIGIDAVIKKIQVQLYAELTDNFVAYNPSIEINGYGRVYKNMRGLKKLPEVFLKTENDYGDAFYDDKADLNFFFVGSDNHTSEDEVFYQNSMKIVFGINLKECYAGNDRLDALFHRDVISILRNIPISGKYTITGYETGLERVFNDFSILGIEMDDLHPTHVFAVLIDLNYSLTDKCS